MRSIAVCFACLIPMVSLAQPLTRAEMFESSGKFEAAQRRAIGMRASVSAAFERPTMAVTRAEAIAELYRAMLAFRPKFRLTPRTPRFEPGLIAERNTPASAAQVVELLKFRLLAPSGPLAVGRGDTVTVDDWGDALGMFYFQVSSLTHRPSTVWTPALQPIEEGG